MQRTAKRGVAKGFQWTPRRSHNVSPKGVPIQELWQYQREDENFIPRAYCVTEDNKIQELKVLETKQNLAKEKTKHEFERLVKEWVSAIKYKSLESQQTNHDAFFRIIAIGGKVLPSVFEEFSKRPFVAWLRALPAIVGHDVASEAKSFPEAVELWKEWGKTNGYLPK